jgi:hypothetical protein
MRSVARNNLQNRGLVRKEETDYAVEVVENLDEVGTKVC